MTPDEAIAAWNTRPTEDALRADVERLRRALDSLMVPPPGTKGMGPKDRADRLYAAWLGRISSAKTLINTLDAPPPPAL